MVSPVTVCPQNSIALASIQLPPSLFASPVPPAPLADCKLQLLVFRNGKLFCSTGNSSRLADDGKRRSVATPVIYAGTCKGCVPAGLPLYGDESSWGCSPQRSCRAKPLLSAVLLKGTCFFGGGFPGSPALSIPADGCSVGNLTEPVAVSLRHPGEGADPVAAYWNFEVLGGMGGWSAEGCQLAAREPNVTSLHCRHLSNVAVLMVNGAAGGG